MVSKRDDYSGIADVMGTFGGSEQTIKVMLLKNIVTCLFLYSCFLSAAVLLFSTKVYFTVNRSVIHKIKFMLY